VATAPVRQPLFGVPFGMNNGAGGAEGGPAEQEAMLDQAVDPNGWYAGMWRGLTALKSRLYDVAPGLTVQTSEHARQ
jgi:hypothetical protein